MGKGRPTAVATVAVIVVLAAVAAWAVAGPGLGAAGTGSDGAVEPGSDGTSDARSARSIAAGAAAGGAPAAQQRDTGVTRIDTIPTRQISGVVVSDTLSPAEQAMAAHRRADRGPQQPIPFSHRFHVSELQIGCDYCHGGAEESQVAPVPAMSVCMGCHRTVGRDLPSTGQIASAWNAEEPVAWNRVYKVPEFVQFRHRPHVRNDIECQECHGPVQEMDRVYQASSLSMGWCLSCHRQQPQDSDVATNAKLVEDAHVPDAPEGRQPVGLYPRTIESGYAGARAPDDCATCHY